MLLHSRFVLLLVGSITCLCTLSSVKYLAALVGQGSSSAASDNGEEAWRSIIGRAETNIGSHLPAFVSHEAGAPRSSSSLSSDNGTCTPLPHTEYAVVVWQAMKHACQGVP
jgi:hypothetical protein